MHLQTAFQLVSVWVQDKHFQQNTYLVNINKNFLWRFAAYNTQHNWIFSGNSV